MVITPDIQLTHSAPLEAREQRSEEVHDTVEVYLFPEKGYRVEVVGPKDSRVDAAIEMEIKAMAELGDPEHEVREEFEPYRDSSLYLLAFKYDAAKSEQPVTDCTSDKLKGMARLLPCSEAGGDKTLIDLASIPDWGEANRSVTEGMLARGMLQVWDEEQECLVPALPSVLEEFKKESGCESIDNAIDIATVGFELDMEHKERLELADPLIQCITLEILKMYEEGKVTHVTSFNWEGAHEYFKWLGYPFHDMFGLKPMMYDSFRSGEGMVAQPAWLSVQDVYESLENPPTPHVAEVAKAKGFKPLDNSAL